MLHFRKFVAIFALAAVQNGVALRKSSLKNASEQGNGERWAQAVMPCNAGTAALTTAYMSSGDYDAAVESVARRYHSLSTKCNATFCPQADWSACILRGAGHDFMDFKAGAGGGSDGCVDLHDEDNNGLHECLYLGEFGVSVLDAYQEHCTKISLADYLVIAGEAVMQLSREHVLKEDSSRMSISFKANFRYGRTTAQTCTWAIGRLPDAEDSCTGTEEVFIKNMGLSWRESAAMMGVHTLGRADPRHSGYDGFWSDSKNQRRFNNDYFSSVLNKGWKPESVNGNPKKNQWFRSDEGRDDATLGREMMLNTDMCLAYVHRGREVNAGELVRANKPCCAWRFNSDEWFNPPGNNYYSGDNLEFCGHMGYDVFQELWAFGEQRFMCCRTHGPVTIDCGDSFELMGPAFEDMKEFAESERAWLKEFLKVWKKSTELGHTNLKRLR